MGFPTRLVVGGTRFLRVSLLALSACQHSPAARSTEPSSSTASLAPLLAQPAAQAPQDCEARIDADNRAELARWTPALHADARKLAERTPESAEDAIRAALAGSHRRPGNADRDAARHPLETLQFFGFAPSQTVLEFQPAEGWYTEILAAALVKRGKLLVTASDANGPASPWFICSGKRIRALLARSPELYGTVEVLEVDHDSVPRLGVRGSVDLALVKLKLHRLLEQGTLEPWLEALRQSLKPSGVLAIEEPRAVPGAKVEESAAHGYLPEEWVIERVQAHGFRLVAKSELNANPNDARETPAELRRQSGSDHTESDRMTLKFVRSDAPQPGSKT